MAKITTITNPLTGQPAQVDQLDHTAQQIDDGIGFESTDYPGCYYRTVDGVVEWLNPPMLLGKEYRTTERYQGKPVYAQYFTLGTFPTGGQSWIDYPSTVSGIVDIVRYSGSTGSNLTPYKDNNNVYNISPAKTRAMVYCNDPSGGNYTINLTLWYTKT